ncbi:hypothetical protein PM082_016997 [Marasmius tenuissimus]|nr:hypothetical protein PM082_016997 [Marasmius tenuissimus]
MTRNTNSLALVLLTFGAVSWAQSGLPTFNWTTIEPSTSLSWVDCYEAPLQCARFEVPLNHSQPNDGKTTAIAVIKYPAAANASTQVPGGPGGSGVELVIARGAGLQKIVGTQFDVVSFDPRGIGATTPKISVFNSTEEATQFVAGEVWDLNATSTAIEEQYERYQLFGKLAADRDVDGFLSHVSTDNVARDMLGIAVSMGQEKLQYWGFSYGSALGSIFATMFPDRVGRLIIDGCLDMDSYLRNNLGNQMADADKAMQWFVDDCVAAGPEACPLHASSSTEVNANLNSLLEDIRTNPIKVELDSNTTVVITYGGLRSLIFSTLNAVAGYQELATGLKQLSEGNGTYIAAGIAGMLQNEVQSNEGFVAVECSDADPLDMGPSELRKYMAGINSTFAGLTAMQAMTRCTGWKIHPESRFKGPVGANTSFPLLIIGNTADTVTPLIAAQKNHAAFPGSGLLVQDSPGHASLAARSLCTSRAVAAYFANGTLPEEGTVCAIDEELFPQVGGEDASDVTARPADTLLRRGIRW